MIILGVDINMFKNLALSEENKTATNCYYYSLVNIIIELKLPLLDRSVDQVV